MAPAQHLGRVTEAGELRLRDRAGWLRAIARHKGREVWLSIKRVGSERTSRSTHGYYRSTVLPLACEEWGWSDPDELHFRFKEKHLPGIIPIEEWPYRKVGKEEMREPPSMANFTQEQSSRFVQAVIDQMTEAGINVPPPRGKP